MTDLEALYSAILKQPEEDTPRLMYADALDERGTPGDADRAMFIRLQMELDSIGSRPRSITKVKKLTRKSHALLAKTLNWLRWSRPAFADAVVVTSLVSGTTTILVGQHHDVWEYHRGFLSQVRVSWQHWLRYCLHLTGNCPITDVWLSGTPSVDRYRHNLRRYEGDRLEEDYWDYQLVINPGLYLGIYPSPVSVHFRVMDQDAHKYDESTLRLELLKANWPSVRNWHFADNT